MIEYTCHSGGAIGSDLCWEIEGEKYGVETIAYSFQYHTTESKNKLILSDEELREGWENIQIAEKTLKRGMNGNVKLYIYRLLCRNWFQVKNSETIFAIGEFLNTKKTKVKGGTGWAVQMGIDNNKPVFVFDQTDDTWYTYLYQKNEFVKVYGTPRLTKNFAGIGTRSLNRNGTEAIKRIYRHNIEK
jgi:hypothetical protein